VGMKSLVEDARTRIAKRDAASEDGFCVGDWELGAAIRAVMQSLEAGVRSGNREHVADAYVMLQQMHEKKVGWKHGV
jgi:hypothetical protein